MRQRISEEDSCLKRRLIDYILINFKSQDLSIQSVSECTGIPQGRNPDALKEETGQGFVQYVSYLRLNEFKRMLEQSDLTIRELVLYVGYNDVPNFLLQVQISRGNDARAIPTAAQKTAISRVGKMPQAVSSPFPS